MASRNSILFKIKYILLGISFITIPYSTFLLLPIAILLLILWIVEGDWKNKLATVRHNENRFFFYTLIALFFLNIISIFWSDNKILGYHKVETTIWMLTAPFSTFSIKFEKEFYKKIHFLLALFLFSIFTTIIVNLALSYNDFIANKELDKFFYTNLSHFMHPSYQSLYACTALILIFYLLKNEDKYKLLKFEKIIYLIEILFICLYVIFLQSRSGIIVLAFLALVMGLYIINNRKIYVLSTILYLIVLSGLLLLMLKISYKPLNRIGTLIENIKINDYKIHTNDNIRFHIWKYAFITGIESMPLGTGSGDIQQKLDKQYTNNGFPELAERHYNAHNQFLQSFASLGIAGLLFTTLIVLLPLVKSIKAKNITILLFAAALSVFLFNESMFERRAGCDFIFLMLSLLLEINNN